MIDAERRFDHNPLFVLFHLVFLGSVKNETQFHVSTTEAVRRVLTLSWQAPPPVPEGGLS
jgi:hypothetical protein